MTKKNSKYWHLRNLNQQMFDNFSLKQDRNDVNWAVDLFSFHLVIDQSLLFLTVYSQFLS